MKLISARATFLACLVLTAAHGAEDTWTRLQSLKTGTELKVYKTGASVPIMAQYGDSTDNSLTIIVKDKQSALQKDDIERIDYRPSKGSKVKVSSTTKTQDPPVNQTSPLDSHVPSTSYSAGIGNGSKPDFEVLYQRQSTPPKTPAAK